MPGPSTTAVHAGEGDATGNVNTPIHQASTFRYPELADGSPSSLIYTRYDNPTIAAVEAKLAALEGADHALLFSSGMAAVQTVCQALLSPGDTLAVQRGVYGGTTAYLEQELARMGIDVVAFDAFAPPDLPDATRLVWVESITNPLLRVTDVPAWADAAHAVGARLVVDATFATPVHQRPLDLGADVVMHSASKYLGGHSDLIAGALCCNDTTRGGTDASPGEEATLRDVLWRGRRNLGGVMDPHAAYLLGRGMKTLALRMERHAANALALAEALAGAVRVVHPGRADHPDHDVATRLVGGHCGMLALDLGSLDAAVAFRRAVRVLVPAASLGGVESLVSLPAETSHAYATPEDRARDGITDGLVRISVGIEDVDDLIADVRQALEATVAPDAA